MIVDRSKSKTKQNKKTEWNQRKKERRCCILECFLLLWLVSFELKNTRTTLQTRPETELLFSIAYMLYHIIVV